MTGNRCLSLFLLWLVLLPGVAPAADTYKIDPTHSTIGFAVKHMEVGITRGVFTDYHGGMAYDPEDLSAFRSWVVVRTDSIDTRLPARDKHLKSADFFDVETYPTIVFIGKKLVKKGNGYQIFGELTMKGVAKEVSGPAMIRGPVATPMGGISLGVSGETVVNRQDYGISWNDVMPDGGFVVGNDVRIIIDVEGDKK